MQAQPLCLMDLDVSRSPHYCFVGECSPSNLTNKHREMGHPVKSIHCYISPVQSTPRWHPRAALCTVLFVPPSLFSTVSVNIFELQMKSYQFISAGEVNGPSALPMNSLSKKITNYLSSDRKLSRLVVLLCNPISTTPRSSVFTCKVSL